MYVFLNKAFSSSLALSLLLSLSFSPLSSRYYAVCFLNQVVIGHEEVGLAMKLVNIYFSFFKVIYMRHTSCMALGGWLPFQVYIQREQYDAKILSGLLTGLNRALPFLRGGMLKSGFCIYLVSAHVTM